MITFFTVSSNLHQDYNNILKIKQHSQSCWMPASSTLSVTSIRTNRTRTPTGPTLETLEPGMSDGKYCAEISVIFLVSTYNRFAENSKSSGIDETVSRKIAVR